MIDNRQLTQPPLPAPVEDFLGLDKRHYFYSGAEGPSLRAHEDALARYLRNKSAGESGRSCHEDVLKSCRSSLAHLLGCSADDIAVLSNASEALSRVAGAIPWSAGANVVTSNLEFPSVVQPLLNLRRRGVDVRIVPHRSWHLDIDDIAAAVDKDTQAIFVSHVSYANGLRLDLAALADVARAAHALLVVDATHSLGVVPVDAAEADVVLASTYKWLLGPHGVGIFYCRDPERVDLSRTGVGWRSVPDVLAPDRYERFELWPSVRRFERGYPSFPSLYLLDASLGYLERYSPARTEAHIHRLGTRLIEGLARLGLDVITPVEPRSRAGNISALAHDGAGLARTLAERGVMVWGGDGRIRFSVHLFNTDENVDAAVFNLSELVP